MTGWAGTLATCSRLGLKWSRSTRFVQRDGRTLGPYLRYHFSAFQEFPVFRLRRKRQRLCPSPKSHGARGHRQIVAIEPVPSVPVRCVQVNSPSRMYLAGRKMVPTHNSTICESACIWAVLYGHRDFVCLIGQRRRPCHGHARLDQDGTRRQRTALGGLSGGCYPIQCLDGIANRCNGQLYQGQRTHIGWTAREVVLPTMPNSVASGAIIKVAGITGRIRGMKYKRADGHTVRPSLVVLDDPQTDESARSLSQCATRESILAGACGPAVPGKKISGSCHAPSFDRAIWRTAF